MIHDLTPEKEMRILCVNFPDFKTTALLIQRSLGPMFYEQYVGFTLLKRNMLLHYALQLENIGQVDALYMAAERYCLERGL